MSKSTIIKNTAILYIRMMLTMVLSLFTSRVVLNTLGIIDYGVYGVVGSIVTLFSFLNLALITAGQRCLAVELGSRQGEYLRVFNAIFTYCVIVAVVVFFLLSFLGSNIISQLNIPSTRLDGAKALFNLSCVSFLLSTLQIPFTSSLIAMERIHIYSVINVFDIILRFASAYLLTIWEGDLLIMYGVSIVIVNLLTLSLYLIVNRPLNLKFNFDKIYLKEVGRYFGWNLLGGISSVSLLQGLQILLNLFFNPIVNAAQTLTVQVKAAVETFASNIRTASTPQIIKHCAAGNFEETLNILSLSIKLSTVVILIICIPVFIKVEYILKLWLGGVPEFTGLFIRLMLINCVIDVVSSPVVSIIQTAGNIRSYQIVISVVLLSVLPISYVFFHLGLEPYYYAFAIIGSSIIIFFIRLLFLKRIIPLSLNHLYTMMLIQVFLMPIVVFIPSHYASSVLTDGYISLIVIGIISIFSTLSFGFYFLLSHNERIKLRLVLKQKFSKV